jgi:PAS domain S-box-containing protein
MTEGDMREEAPDMEDSFFTLSLDMLCIADLKTGYFVKLNPAWERILGYTLEELRSQPMFDFVHPDDLQRTLDQNRAVRTGGQALSFENRYRCKDGSFRWLLWNATPDFERQVIYAVARDITERKRSEEERERLLRELQAALAEVKVLQKILPICMYCRKVRDDVDFWDDVETYLAKHTETRFSHGVCPPCYERVMGELGDTGDTRDAQ